MDRDERELRALQQELNALLLEMEFHHEKDSPEEFEHWWRVQGHEAEYFQRKGRIEQKMETIRKMKLLSEMDLREYME